MSARLKIVENETGVIDRALEIATKRRNILVRLKAAIRAKKWREAERLITELVPDETRSGADSRIHGIASR